MLLGLCRKLHSEIFESERPVHLEGEIYYFDYLSFNLFGPAEYMSVVLSKLPYPEQSVHHTAGFVAVH